MTGKDSVDHNSVEHAPEVLCASLTSLTGPPSVRTPLRPAHAHTHPPADGVPDGVDAARPACRARASLVGMPTAGEA